MFHCFVFSYEAIYLGKKSIYLAEGWFSADNQLANQPTKTNSMHPRNNNQVSELWPFTWGKNHLLPESWILASQSTVQPTFGHTNLLKQILWIQETLFYLWRQVFKEIF